MGKRNTTSTIYVSGTPAATPVSGSGGGGIRYDAATNQWMTSSSGGVWTPFGASGGGTFTVATIADLSAIDDTTVPNGTNVAVASVRDLWELDTTSALAVDGITVAATASGSGRWVRREIASEVWAKQPAWFIDPVGGDDEDDGSTAGTALATWAEYARRVGELETANAQSVTFLGDTAESEYAVRGVHPGGLAIQGSDTQIDTGTFTTVQAWDSTTTPVTRAEISDGGQDFSPHVGSLIRVTSGAAAGVAAWILAANPSGGGVTTARVSEWFNPTTFSLAVPSPGDDYEIVSLTPITGEWSIHTRDVGFDSFVDFRNLAVSAPVVGFHGVQPLKGRAGLVAFSGSKFTAPTNTSNRHYTGDLQFYGALVESAAVVVKDGQLVMFASALRDGQITLERANMIVQYNNPAQVVAGGDHDQENLVEVRQASSVSTGGNATARGASLGACDQNIGGTAFLSVRPFAQVRRDANGRYWTIDQAANTIGVEVEACGLCSWEPGSVCADGYDLDVGGAGVEFVVGTTTTDAATLAAAGTIDAATNAAAVRRALS